MKNARAVFVAAHAVGVALLVQSCTNFGDAELPWTYGVNIGGDTVQSTGAPAGSNMACGAVGDACPCTLNSLLFCGQCTSASTAQQCAYCPSGSTCSADPCAPSCSRRAPSAPRECPASNPIDCQNGKCCPNNFAVCCPGGSYCGATAAGCVAAPTKSAGSSTTSASSGGSGTSSGSTGGSTCHNVPAIANVHSQNGCPGGPQNYCQDWCMGSDKDVCCAQQGFPYKSCPSGSSCTPGGACSNTGQDCNSSGFVPVGGTGDCAAACGQGGGQTRLATCAPGEAACPDGKTCCPSNKPYAIGSQCYGSVHDACSTTGGSCPMWCVVR